jgi:hypothetical protein
MTRGIQRWVRPLATALVSVVAGLTALSSPANSQPVRIYPYCLVFYEGVGRYSHQECGFTSFDQCMATQLGRGGMCEQNPEWIAQQQQKQQQKQGKKPRQK